MKIVLAPDSFKGSMSSKEVCDCMSIGIKKALPTAKIVKAPMADGGDGTLETLINLYEGHYVTCNVLDPLGNEIIAKYGLIKNNQIAFIAMSEASGIDLISKRQLNPIKATSYGTGQLILDAINKGVKHIYIGLGGSATNDGGQGMAKALGVSFTDVKGNEIVLGNGNLSNLKHISLHSLNKKLANVKFTILSDVQNPLTGPKGASAIFGPQKGANHDSIKILDNNLKIMAQTIHNDLDIDVDSMPGAGAAGGMGAALIAFTNSTFVSGADFIMQKYNLKEQFKDCDYVFTGEGSIDAQSRFGKVTGKITDLAKTVNPNCKVIGLGGIVAENIKALNMDAAFSITNGSMSLEDSIKAAHNLTIDLSENIMRLIK
ncbi:glycerate kinase [Apilactobacillus sp. M161]|uniref:Glycerate kinase n=1 Tax=Apilactobacillus xinyiensis TaxID=2841032 RepID=A0ABT0I103_9LACO|nr:glycerate kinase [Apilactobacillus xinyiensis]MCK8624512.1 glycerate kinase [Apilactobacillus xinyiensis]